MSGQKIDKLQKSGFIMSFLFFVFNRRKHRKSIIETGLWGLGCPVRGVVVLVTFQWSKLPLIHAGFKHQVKAGPTGTDA